MKTPAQTKTTTLALWFMAKLWLDKLCFELGASPPARTRRDLTAMLVLAAEALLDTLDTGHELSRTDKEGSSGYRRRGDLYVDFYNEHQGGDSETVLSRDAMRDRLQAVYTDHATGGLEDTFTRGAYLREDLAHLGFETLRLYGLSRASRG